ncbi:MAG: Tm-1-like ATP-binding domain-containing protein, partial [Gammaproteobacteria bacterium]|nr:Tm-1-like ATP-binding domain-containing protein [Gammaproteobacteria bacterium]
MSVYLLATLDTKGREIAYVRDRLRDANIATTLMDTGCIGDPWADVTADITREQVFEAAGTSLAEMRRRGDRGEAVSRAAEGAAAIVREAHTRGKVSGVLAIGGSAGTAIGTSAMRVLPLGLPKVMVST